MEVLDIYVDGACEKNGLSKPRAGWAFVITKHNSDNIIVSKKGKIRSGEQHSNRAELEAMYQALKYCKDKEDCFIIYTDSEVTESGINGKAKRRAYRDIWDDIEEVCVDLKNVLVQKIPGHQEIDCVQKRMNDKVDELAKQASRSLLDYMALSNNMLEELI